MNNSPPRRGGGGLLEDMNSPKKIGIAAIGDVLDINCWSNIPYYFYKAGNTAGLFHHPWRLNLNQFKKQRYFWNLRQLLTSGKYGGFQYSESFLNQAEQSIDPTLFKTTIISFNQHFPRSSSVVKAGGEIYRYLDATLFDLLKEPSYGFQLSKETIKKALELEKHNYHLSKKIVVMANWAKESLIDFYEVPSEKVSVILPGANFELSEHHQFKPFVPGAGKSRPFILGFIGKDWKRKGLDVVRKLQLELQKKGYLVVVRIIGYAPAEITNARDVEYKGFIDKHNKVEDFIKEVSTCDVGCVFSKSEALGISTLEFLRLGVPVAGYSYQGLKDTLIMGASMKFKPNDSFKFITENFIDYLENEDVQSSMYWNTATIRDKMTWERCILEWKGLFSNG